MKIRNSFVSNSSSSSFIIYGIEISEEEVRKYADKKYSDDKEYNNLNKSEIFDIVDFLQSNDSLEFVCDYECDDYYIGRSFEKIRDNETGKQFKESVEKQLSEVFGKVKCRTIDITINS